MGDKLDQLRGHSNNHKSQKNVSSNYPDIIPLLPLPSFTPQTFIHPPSQIRRLPILCVLLFKRKLLNINTN